MSPKLLWNGLPHTNTHFRSNPLLCLTCPLMLNFFNPRIFFNPTLHTPICNWWLQTMAKAYQGFLNSMNSKKWWNSPQRRESDIFLGLVVLSGSLNLRRSDFDHLNINLVGWGGGLLEGLPYPHINRTTFGTVETKYRHWNLRNAIIAGERLMQG